jgi:pimeloyl-ACP methyl ester carboxylesterase
MPRLALRLALVSLIGLAAASAVADTAAAQERPTVFIHGFNSDGSGWSGTAERLRASTAIAPLIPNVSWRQIFQDQVGELNRDSTYASLPGSTIAIGHSNGGLAAREWSKTRPLSGVVTIGTPHRGAPILPQIGHWAAFSGSTTALVARVVQAYAQPTDWSWTISHIANLLGWSSEFAIWSVSYLATAFGLNQALPVSNDMHPYGGYVADLNGSSNLSREAHSIAGRVGVVSVAHDFFYAGPARAIIPGQADTIAALLYSSAYGLMGWANYILGQADPMDLHSINQALSLLSLSGQLLSIDPVYCSMVSTLERSRCDTNDGLVPYWSQEYPNAQNLYIGYSHNDGPAHIQEREAGTDILYTALVAFLQVPPRSAGSPPAPGPAPGDTTDPGDPGGEDAPENSGTLSPDTALHPGDSLASSNGLYHLVYQGDGNLVLYDDGGRPLWASHTDGSAPGVAVMQGDGNFVIYNGYSDPIWHTATHGYGGAYLEVGNDGNVVIYDASGSPLWATGTAR